MSVFREAATALAGTHRPSPGGALWELLAPALPRGDLRLRECGRGPAAGLIRHDEGHEQCDAGNSAAEPLEGSSGPIRSALASLGPPAGQWQPRIPLWSRPRGQNADTQGPIPGLPSQTQRVAGGGGCKMLFGQAGQHFEGKTRASPADSCTEPLIPNYLMNEEHAVWDLRPRVPGLRGGDMSGGLSFMPPSGLAQ